VLVAVLVMGQVGALLEEGRNQRQQPVRSLLQVRAMAAKAQGRKQHQQIAVVHGPFDLLALVVDAAAAGGLDPSVELA
jgi:hypothetical protein